MHNPETFFQRAIRDFRRRRKIFPQHRGIRNELSNHRQRMAAPSQQHLNRRPSAETEGKLAGAFNGECQGLVEFRLEPFCKGTTRGAARKASSRTVRTSSPSLTVISPSANQASLLALIRAKPIGRAPPGRIFTPVSLLRPQCERESAQQHQ